MDPQRFARLCFLVFTWIGIGHCFHHTVNKELIKLKRQIAALDKFIHSRIIKKPLMATNISSEFPDLRDFSQLYETSREGVKDTSMCSGCEVGIGLLMVKVRDFHLSLEEIQEMTENICKYFKIGTPEVCRGLLERYSPSMYYIFKERPQLTSKAFCGVFLQSYGCSSNDPYLDWKVSIPEKPNNKVKVRYPSKKVVRAEQVKIVQLSDIHVDPLYEPYANAECDNQILCCQGSQGRPLNEKYQAGYFGDGRKCDLPYGTLDLALQDIAKQHSDLKFLYLTGDIIPHDIWSTTRDDNTQIIQNTAQRIYKYLPDAKIIPVLGNHETHPVNFYSPPGVPEDLDTSWIYNVTYEAYKQWIPEDQAELYKKSGYYLYAVDDTFSVIVLNSNFCYEFNVWQAYDPQDYGNQLNWLIEQLQTAESSNKTVHIVGHVPPGHSECVRVWSKNFYEIMLRYHHIIKGQFYGHTHYSEFKLYYDENQKPINNLWVAPSLTPYDINNAAYRVYFADSNNYEILDHDTWLFDLKKANTNITENPRWFKYFTSTTDYQIPDVTPQSMDIFVKRMAEDEKIFDIFYNHYHQIIDGSNEAKECDVYCRKRILCAIVQSYNGEMENCASLQKKIDGKIVDMAKLLIKH